MTTAAELRNELQALGVTLAADGARLRFHPRDRVTGELLARLRTCKGELLAMLQPHDAGPVTAGPSVTDRPAGDSPQDLPGGDRHGADGPHGDHIDAGQALQPRPVTVPRTWPPAVPSEILADPIPTCGDCGRPRSVVPGQPGRPAGLCFDCWGKRR